MRRLLALGVLAMVFATAACGGSSGADAEVASATGASGADTEDVDTNNGDDNVDREQAGLDFARCMREHGVDMPDPQMGEGGFVKVGPISASAEPMDGGPMTKGDMPENFREADEACRHFLDDLIQDGGPPMDAAAQDKALEFAKCMREHGVDMPDPDFSGGGGMRIEIGAGGIDPGSDTFQEAQEACGSLFGPGGGPGEVRAGVAVAGGKS